MYVVVIFQTCEWNVSEFYSQSTSCNFCMVGVISSSRIWKSNQGKQLNTLTLAATALMKALHWRSQNEFGCLTYSLNLLKLGLLLLNGLLGTNLFTFIHPGSCCLLNHGKDLKERSNALLEDPKRQEMFGGVLIVRNVLPLVASYLELWWSFPKILKTLQNKM